MISTNDVPFFSMLNADHNMTTTTMGHETFIRLTNKSLSVQFSSVQSKLFQQHRQTLSNIIILSSTCWCAFMHMYKNSNDYPTKLYQFGQMQPKCVLIIRCDSHLKVERVKTTRAPNEFKPWAESKRSCQLNVVLIKVVDNQ